MTNRTQQHLDRAIASSRFEFGNFISRGFDLWKEQAGLYIVFGLLFMVITGVVGLVPIVGSLVNQIIVSPLLIAGAYIFSHKLANKERPEFNTFFDGSKHAGNLIGLYALYVMAMVILIAPLFLFMGINIDILSGDEEAILEMLQNLSPLLLLYLIPFAIIAFAFGYSSHFVIFYDLSIIDSIKYSVKIFFKHPVMLFFYYIVVILIAMSGIIGLCIAILVTYSMMFPMMYVPFRHITQLEEFESGDSDRDVYDTLVEVL